jgi:hypothetical protein
MKALLDYAAAHPFECVGAALSLALVLWKRLPAATRAAAERRYPRLANAARFALAILPDLVAAVASAKRVATGTPKYPAPQDTTRRLRAIPRDRETILPEPKD